MNFSPVKRQAPQNDATGGAAKGFPSTSISPASVSMRMRDPFVAAWAAPGASKMARPRLTQLRRKIRAKLWPITAGTPQAFSACTTCSREEPNPKFRPVTTIVSGPSRSRSVGS